MKNIIIFMILMFTFSCNSIREGLVKTNLENSVYTKGESEYIQFKGNQFQTRTTKKDYSVSVKKGMTIFVIDKEIILCKYPELPSVIVVDSISYEYVGTP